MAITTIFDNVFSEIQCTLSDPNLATSPQSGECTTSATNWGEECEIKCKSGYAVGTAIAEDSKHHLKCQGTTVANGAWKQRDSTSDDSPTCQSKFLDDDWCQLSFSEVTV